MPSRLLPLIIGGLLPAVLYGVAGIIQKLSAQNGGSATTYLIGFGVATALTGALLHFTLGEGNGTTRSIVYAFGGGVVFALGAGLISTALIRFQSAISQLAPLYNTNVLVTVVIGALLLGEYRGLDIRLLLFGTVLIVIGAVLVANA
jgi:transporter family protein